MQPRSNLYMHFFSGWLYQNFMMCSNEIESGFCHCCWCSLMTSFCCCIFFVVLFSQFSIFPLNLFEALTSDSKMKKSKNNKLKMKSAFKWLLLSNHHNNHNTGAWAGHGKSQFDDNIDCSLEFRIKYFNDNVFIQLRIGNQQI